MNKSRKMALGGILCAIIIIFLFLAGITNTIDLCLVLASSAVITIIIIELDKKYAFIMYAATAILCFFVIPHNMATILYIFFFGYYPIVKSLTEKQKSRVLEYIVKFANFTLALLVSIFLYKTLFFEGKDVSNIVFVLIIAAANAIFLIYDIALTKFVILYMMKLRKRILYRQSMPIQNKDFSEEKDEKN